MSSHFTARKGLKLVHELGSIGLTGALVIQWLMLEFMPPTTELEAYAAVRAQLGMVSRYVLFPSLAAVLVSGLLSMAWTEAYKRAGWVWLKLAFGVSVFEGTLVGIQGPAQREAELALRALAGEADPALLASSAAQEWRTTLIILFIALANVVLSVWRPRFSSRGAARAVDGDSQSADTPWP